MTLGEGQSLIPLLKGASQYDLNYKKVLKSQQVSSTYVIPCSYVCFI